MKSIYANKTPAEASWYQLEPAVSLELIALTGIGHIDVCGGASVLVDKLIGQRFHDLTVLDISSKALWIMSKKDWELEPRR